MKLSDYLQGLKDNKQAAQLYQAGKFIEEIKVLEEKAAEYDRIISDHDSINNPKMIMSIPEYYKLRAAETYWEMLDRLPEFTILERMVSKWHLYDGYENFVDDIPATPSCNTPAEALHKYWESKK